MQNFGTIIDNFDAVTKQYVDDKASAKRISGIKVDNATLADTAKKVQNAFTYKAHNKAAGTVVPITYDGRQAASLDFSANDFTYDYSSGKDIKIKLVDKDYATTAQVNAKQNALTETQLAAVDSGITEAKRTKYDGYEEIINQKANSADLATVATSGNYNDLSNKPTIPTDYVKYTAQTLTDAQKSQARSNIGAGTSNFSGNYNDLTNPPKVPTFSLSGTTLTITTN